MKSKNILVSVMMIILIANILNLILLISAHEKIKNIEYQGKDCSGLDLFNTSYCLRNELALFYKYNISNLDNDLNLNELKDLGGVCWHYAEYYDNRLKELGFNSKLILVNIKEKLDHEFTITSNEEGYCVLDQLIVRCVELKT